jgi:GMP synthase-like glutamine amidotransferase
MRAHYLQHVPFEGLGSIENWLQNAGYEITSTKFYESAELPSPNEIDFLVVMGGPMSINDGEQYSWLVLEKKFIRNVIEYGKPVLGICLETTPESAQELVANCRDELTPSLYVQSEEKILSKNLDGYRAINQLMGDVLSYLLQRNG